jgi:hypothetical protein
MIYGAGQVRQRLDSRAEEILTQKKLNLLRQAVTAEQGNGGGCGKERMG